MKHPIRIKLYNKLSILRDKRYVWSRPIDWVRYELLWNEDMEER